MRLTRPRNILLLWLPLCALLLSPSLSSLRACNIPVFRYALERWRPDPFEVIVGYKGLLTSPQQKALDTLKQHSAESTREATSANFVLTVVDLKKRTNSSRQQLFTGIEEADLPWMVVRGRDIDDKKVVTWAGKLSPESVAQLLDSGLRRELVKRILSGETAVWVLLESGEKAKDDAAAVLLESELRQLASTLTLPVLTDAPEDRVSARGPPLRVAFSMLRLRRDDPAERLLVPMFLHSEGDLAGRIKKEPMAFAVFGRGHCLAALVGAGLTAENIKKSCALLLAPCTCDAQEEMEWFELLMTSNWLGAVGQTSSLPEASAGKMPAPRSEGEEAGPLVPRWLLLSGVGVAAVLVVVTGAWALRSGHKGRPR
jgi:hypothetical protein